SLTVRDWFNASMTATQTGIAVTPAAGASFSVTALHGVVAGTGQTLTVTVRDAYGNLASGYTGTVAFSSSDTLADLHAANRSAAHAGPPPNNTCPGPHPGAHTFSFALKTAGTQSVPAQDSVDATIAGTQSSVLVKAAAASALIATGPTTTTAGVAQPFTVTV